MKCNKSCSFLFFYIKPFIESPLKKNLCHYSTKSVLSGYNKKVVNTTFKFFSYISWKKGYASSIYFSKKNSLKYEEKSKYPDLLKTVAEPKSEKSDSKVNNWKREMAKLRRQYLTEYVMEQKKNDELKKKEIKEKPLVFKTETSNLSSDENFDECIPTIQSSFKNEYQLLDINKSDRINRKMHNFEISKKKEYKNRLRHFLTLYSRSEKFITTMEELDNAINKCFQEVPTGFPPCYNIQFLRNKKEASFYSKNTHMIHSEVFDALLGTVDGGELGPDELIEINNIRSKEKLGVKD